MPIVNIDNLHVLGVNQDFPNHKLPPEGLTLVKNARFYDGAVHKIEGHSEMMGSLTIAPHCIFPWNDGSAYQFIYANGTAIYKHDGTTETDITRTVGGAYSGGSKPKWTGGVFNGIPVLNNNAFADVPQSWDGSTDMQDLPNWPASTYCKILRPLGNFLIAMDMSESANHYPYKIRWSTAAPAGGIPTTWVAAANNYAGSSLDLAETSDFLVDMLPYGNVGIIYKEEHVWIMQYEGLPNVFNFNQLFSDFGLLTLNCAVNFKRQQLCVSKNDIIVHNANSWNSIASRKVKRNIFQVMDQSNYDTTFAVLNSPFSEVWICYPETGETYPNIAAIWNYETDTWSYRELPGIRAATQGLDISAAASASFDGLSGTFDAQIGVFDELPYNPAVNQLVLADTTNSAILRADYTNQFAGVSFETIIQRLSLPIVGQDRQGNPAVNLNAEKIYRRIRPKMMGSGTVYWRLGIQNEINGSVAWENEQAYEIGVDDFIDFDRSGKMLCYQVRDNANQDWSLSGFELDMDIISRYG